MDMKCYHIIGVGLRDLELDILGVSNLAAVFFSVDGG